MKIWFPWGSVSVVKNNQLRHGQILMLGVVLRKRRNEGGGRLDSFVPMSGNGKFL